jgi:hypothetical protein
MASELPPVSSFKLLITGAGGETGYWLGKELETSSSKFILLFKSLGRLPASRAA